MTRRARARRGRPKHVSLVPMLLRPPKGSGGYGIHSHAGAWEREKLQDHIRVPAATVRKHGEWNFEPARRTAGGFWLL